MGFSTKAVQKTTVSIDISPINISEGVLLILREMQKGQSQVGVELPMEIGERREDYFQNSLKTIANQFVIFFLPQKTPPSLCFLHILFSKLFSFLTIFFVRLCFIPYAICITTRIIIIFYLTFKSIRKFYSPSKDSLVTLFRPYYFLQTFLSSNDFFLFISMFHCHSRTTTGTIIILYLTLIKIRINLSSNFSMQLFPTFYILKGYIN